MKNLITRTLTSLMLAAMWLPMAAQASSVVKANIPFEFSFNGKTFPAGDYSLVQPLDHMIALRDANGKIIAQAFTEGVESLSSADATKLKFDNVEGQYILSEVWQRYDSSGVRMFPEDRQSNLAMHRSTESRAAAEGSQP